MALPVVNPISFKFTGQPYDLNTVLSPDQVWAKLDLGAEEVRQDVIALTDVIEADYETKADLTTTRKLSAAGDFTGTLNGVAITSTEPGLSSAFNAHVAENVTISSYPKVVLEIDDTGRINRAIADVASKGGGILNLLPEIYDISGTILLKSKVRVIGKNSDVSFKDFLTGLPTPFTTVFRLANGANCDMVKFADDVYSSSLERVFLIGNRDNQTSGKGVYFEALVSPKSSRNKIEYVQVSSTKDEGIYVSNYAYETKIRSCAVGLSGGVGHAGLYLGGRDCVLEEFSSGYNYGDGIEITFGGALRAYDVDSFYNLGHGIITYDVMDLSFVTLKSNHNAKTNLYIYASVTPGYLPSKIHFVNARFFGCGENYSEVLIENINSVYSIKGLSFINSMLGAENETVSRRYLIENTPTTRRDISLTGCSLNTINYIARFNVSNEYTLTGCVDTYAAMVYSYNRVLKQNGGVDMETIGYAYTSTNASINATKRFTSANALSGSLVLTLPLSTGMNPGQEIIVYKQDASNNTVTINVTGGDVFKNALTNVLSTVGQSFRAITDGAGLWFIVS